ncbi:glycosyltransferase family 2 protein [Azohydromonas aeria]|uniref:glycosyltransferase family 2 protein n=1 Tax=Azohydromonas aeria TaxID=2590212 RepID=UPI0012F8FCF8|nr:glycosyltransferase family 2 protein [Azohydromonas aeria]
MSTPLEPCAPAPRSVSVVIPSRDGRDTLQRALDSLIPGAGFIREAIVVFSNSPAPYVAMATALVERYVAHFPLRLMDSGQRSNGAIARNCGVLSAQGDYVAFLDDDDEWFPDKLPAYFGFIEQRRLGGDFVLFSTVLGCTEDRLDAHPLPSRPYRGEPIAEFVLSFGGGAQSSSLLLPRPLAQRVLQDPALPRHQDYDHCMRLAEHGATFHHLDQPLSWWYQRGSNAAKGGTFDFCARWLLANRARLSDGAITAYVGKELFAAARASGAWATLWRFLWRHLTPRQRARVLRELGARALQWGQRRLGRARRRTPPGCLT